MQQKKISDKKVLLVANATQLSEEIILHGVNLSKRMNTSLEILHLLQREPAQKAIRCFRQNLEKLNPDEAVGYVPLFNHRGLTTETVAYAKNRRNILCVVLCLKGQGVPRKQGIRQEKLEEITQLLHCPVVLYTDSPVG